jgi:hypothetical protein
MGLGTVIWISLIGVVGILVVISMVLTIFTFSLAGPHGDRQIAANEKNAEAKNYVCCKAGDRLRIDDHIAIYKTVCETENTDNRSKEQCDQQTQKKLFDLTSSGKVNLSLWSQERTLCQTRSGKNTNKTLEERAEEANCIGAVPGADHKTADEAASEYLDCFINNNGWDLCRNPPKSLYDPTRPVDTNLESTVYFYIPVNRENKVYSITVPNAEQVILFTNHSNSASHVNIEYGHLGTPHVTVKIPENIRHLDNISYSFYSEEQRTAPEYNGKKVPACKYYPRGLGAPTRVCQ